MTQWVKWGVAFIFIIKSHTIDQTEYISILCLTLYSNIETKYENFYQYSFKLYVRFRNTPNYIEFIV